jgi:predicted nucleic acid-binding protein
MKCYADSSFILQLVVEDFANKEAIDCFRALGRPSLIYTGLHELEVLNGLRLRVFAAAALGSKQRALARSQAATAGSRLQSMTKRGALHRTPVDMDDTLAEATSLAVMHTEVIGSRSLDTLHVAAALLMNADQFLTCDQRQAKLARRAGLKVKLIAAGS